MVTDSRVFCTSCAPLCASIVIGTVSAFAQRLPLAVSAECGPTGRLSTKLVTGTSGIAANVVLVTPFVIFVFPVRITVMPSPSSTMSRSGKASPP